MKTTTAKSKSMLRTGQKMHGTKQRASDKARHGCGTGSLEAYSNVQTVLTAEAPGRRLHISSNHNAHRAASGVI
jgi:hypothetical protein